MPVRVYLDLAAPHLTTYALPMIPPMLSPVADPGPYIPGHDVVLWRPLDAGGYVQEIFRRAEGTYGFRYLAWVAWRDAGGAVREHGWHKLPGALTLVTDTESNARSEAESDLARHGFDVTGEWMPAPSGHQVF